MQCLVMGLSRGEGIGRGRQKCQILRRRSLWKALYVNVGSRSKWKVEHNTYSK